MQVDFVTDRQQWNDIVSSFQRRDFFYCWEYHQQCAHNAETPVLIVARQSQQIELALPMLRREIPNVESEAHSKFDVVSVYGYTGPLLHEDQRGVEMLDAVYTALGRAGCVSGFSRLHPIIHEHLPEHSSIHDAGKTISIECQNELDRMAGYRKTTRYEVRKLARLDARVEFTTGEADFHSFVDIYYQTMRDLEAPESYFFSPEWLRGILNIEGVSATIGVVKFEEQVISAAMFTAVAGLAQYFLGGAKREFSKLAPQKLLLHKACDWAIENDASILHLGGGRGSREDGLYRFKAGFSKRIHPFRVMKFVCDQAAYDRLTNEHASKSGIPINDLYESGFFPAYRANPAIQI